MSNTKTRRHKVLVIKYFFSWLSAFVFKFFTSWTAPSAYHRVLVAIKLFPCTIHVSPPVPDRKSYPAR